MTSILWWLQEEALRGTGRKPLTLYSHKPGHYHWDGVLGRSPRPGHAPGETRPTWASPGQHSAAPRPEPHALCPAPRRPRPSPLHLLPGPRRDLCPGGDLRRPCWCPGGVARRSPVCKHAMAGLDGEAKISYSQRWVLPSITLNDLNKTSIINSFSNRYIWVLLVLWVRRLLVWSQEK